MNAGNDNPGDPVIRVVNLRKSFGPTEVLKGLSLEILRGQVVSIIGASGSGKSTFLRCLNYLETPTSGQIFIDGQSIGPASIPAVVLGQTRRRTSTVCAPSLGWSFSNLTYGRT